MKHWLTDSSSLPRKKVWLGDMTIAVDWDVKKQTKYKESACLATETSKLCVVKAKNKGEQMYMLDWA